MNEITSYRRLEDRNKKTRVRALGDKVVKIKTERNGRSLVKTAFTLLIVFMQLGIVIVLSLLFAIGLKWYIAIMAVLSLISAVSVLSSHRSAQAKAAWVMFILLFFMFGFIIYFMSNDRIMYRKARKRHRAIYAKTIKYALPESEPKPSREMKYLGGFLKNCAGFEAYRNTRVEYFASGASVFDDVLEKLESAEKFVFIEYFAIADGLLLNRFRDILERKLKQGVDVRIIYDDMGSRVLSSKTKKSMKKAGAQIRVFNKLLSRFTFALNYRDHRKIIVIDGKTAYTGGCNLADEYVNEKRMHGYWKDSGLRIEGEAVDAMTLIFLRQWEFVTRKPVDYEKYIKRYERFYAESTVIPYACGPEFEISVAKSVYENVVSAARKKLYIMTPYFIPDDSITQDLINAALSGVDVRLVLPSVPDKYYVYILTRDCAEKLIKHGVKVYYLKDAFVHSKTVLTENCAVVGSVNFDMRSFFQQFENAVVSDDRGLMRDLESDFEDCFANGNLMEQPESKGFLLWFATAILRLVSPLM